MKTELKTGNNEMGYSNKLIDLVQELGKLK